MPRHRFSDSDNRRAISASHGNNPWRLSEGWSAEPSCMGLAPMNRHPANLSYAPVRRVAKPFPISAAFRGPFADEHAAEPSRFDLGDQNRPRYAEPLASFLLRNEQPITHRYSNHRHYCSKVKPISKQKIEQSLDGLYETQIWTHDNTLTGTNFF
jgi:hypothetical protein